jgi:hypothetical protein
MDQNKRDQQHDKRDQRQMPHEQNRDLGNERNEEETGKPVQLDKDGKEQHGGKEHQQGNQPRNPQTEQRPAQGQKTGQR